VPSNIIRVVASFAAALASLLIGFATLSLQDTQSMATVRSALIITQMDEAAPAVGMLRAEARQRDANFYGIRVDPTGRTPTRTLTPIVGDRAAHDRAFPSGEYARFDTGMMTKLEPMDDDARGGYLSTLSPRRLESVATELAGAGVDAQVQSLGWGGLLWYMIGDTPAMMAAAVAVGAAWLVGFARAASCAREAASARTLGARFPFIRDVGMSVLLAAAAFVILAGVAAAVLHVYNGGHRLASYFGASGIVWGALMAAFVCGACAPGVLPRRLRYLPAFSGWRPWARGAFAMSLVQVLTLTLVVFLVTQAGTAWGSLSAVRDSRPDWKACAACTTTIFQGFDGPVALDDAVAPYGSAVRALEPSGGVALSWVPGAKRGDRYAPGDPDSNVIVANSEFIKRSQGRLPDPLGELEGPGEWGLLVPSDQTHQAESVATEWRQYFGEPLSDIPNQAVPKQPHIATYTAGRVFNYGQTDFRDQVYSDSPVIVVVPASAGLLDDGSYFAAGSAGNLLFTGDAAATRRALDAAGVARSVYTIDTLADQIDRGVTTARSKLPIAMIGGIVGLLAVIGMLVVRTRAHVLANRDRLLFHLTLGRSPVRVHLSMWLRTAALLGCAGVAILGAIGAGLPGADIVPRTLGIAFSAIAALTILTNAVIAFHITTPKELITDAR